jgi:CheY-like chemotaxis protein/HPt (histidine-containing phosphotransfer) domain-containing protein
MLDKWDGHLVRLKEQISEIPELREQIAELRSTLDIISGDVSKQRQLLAQLTRNMRNSLEKSSDAKKLSLDLNLLDNPDVGAIVVGADGRELLFNQLAQDLVGFAAKFEAGVTASDWGIYLADKTTRSQSGNYPWQQCAGGKPTQEVVLWIKRPDCPDGIWLRTISMPILNSANESKGAVAFLLDTTELTIVEEQTKQLLSTLAQQVSAIESAQNLLIQLAAKLGEPKMLERLKKLNEFNEGLSRPTTSDSESLVPTSRRKDKNSASTAQAYPTSFQPDSDRSKPKRVLIVDDVPVNQKLLKLQLKRLGCEIDMASNGKEALECLASKDYDIIFMDLDMPIMDGSTASSRIRAAESDTGKHVPIVAVTSYKRDVDRERCLNAGMDDVLIKGCSQAQLMEVITKFAREVIEASPQPGDLLDAPFSKDADTDVSKLQSLQGRPDMNEVIRLFASGLKTFVDCLELAIDEKKPSSVLHFGHCIEGLAAAMGLRQLSAVITEMMAAAEVENWARVSAYYGRLQNHFSDLLAQLGDYNSAAYRTNEVH